jgi:HD-like signal output (HDOD) protein
MFGMLQTCSSSARDIPYGELSSKIDNLPPLHCFLQKFLEIFQDEDAAAADLENILRNDEALSSKIMKIANSAYYGLRGNVNNLSRAIMTIGFRDVKSICLSSLLLDQFCPGSPEGRAQRKKLWKHALSTANHASEIARIRPWIKADQAYLLGLLHDLGWLVMLIHCEDDYRDIQQRAEEAHVRRWEAESGHPLRHTQLGRWVAARWGLPEQYKQVMTLHHVPFQGSDFQPAVGIIYLANVLANSEEDPEESGSDVVPHCCRQLRIREIEWQGHLNRIPTVTREVDKLWGLLS